MQSGLKVTLMAHDSVIRVFPVFERARGLNSSNQLRQGLTIPISSCGNRTPCCAMWSTTVAGVPRRAWYVGIVLAILTGKVPVQKTGKRKQQKLKPINRS